VAIKAIIVHIDDHARSEHRARIGATLAQRFAARIAGVYLVPTAELTASVAALLPPEAVERRLSETGTAQHRAQALFRRSVSTLPSTDTAFLAPAGNAVDAALAHTRCTDLTILGQPGRDSDDAGFTRRLDEQVLLGSGAPILMVPYAPATRSWLQRTGRLGRRP
jgi:nucleotide-binding universal stress UspA family protein